MTKNNAHYLMQEQLGWLRNYQTVSLISWPQIKAMEERTEKSPGFFEEEARCFATEAELPYSDCTGSDNYLRALLEGGHDEERFLRITPGHCVVLSGDGLLQAVRR